MSIGRYKTVGDILAQVGTEVGLGTTVDPFASSNAVWKRLVAYLTTVGQVLAATYDWPHLTAEAVLTKAGGVWTLPTGWTDAGNDRLNVPPDFDHMIPGTHWDRTNQALTGGPLNAQLWQYRQAASVTSLWAEYRMNTNQLWLSPTPLGDRTIAFEYGSRAWVRSAAGGLGNGNTLGSAAGGWDTPEATGDWILYPAPVVVAALILEWKKKTGQNTAQAQKDFDEIITTFLGKTPRAVLSLDGRGTTPHSLVPDTGYGS